MDYKILFLDIDGTILKPDHTYSESTKQAITAAKEKGIEVFLATGRPLHEIGNLAEELDIHSFIGYNGAFALYQDQIVVNEPMDRETVAQFLKTAEEHGHEFVVYTRDTNFFTSLNRPLVQNFIDTFKLQKNDLFPNNMNHDFLGATVMNLSPEQSALYEIEADIHLSPVHVNGVEHTYDIIRKKVNKGFAVGNVLDLLNIDRSQAIAFGDGMNDKEMLQSVGEGFAMGNCHPDLFGYAKNKTTTVSEDGIYNGLKKLGLNI